MDKNNIDSDNSMKKRQSYRLPNVALIFGVMPYILMMFFQFPLLGYVAAFLFFISGWGLGFQVISFILGISSLCIGKKKIGLRGVIFSILSILSPFIGLLILWLLMQSGVEMIL